MPQDDFVTYHIKETNRRLELIEQKLDVLLAARAQGHVIALLIAACTSGLVTFLFDRLR